MLRFRSLGSGSSGNCTLVEATDATHTTRLLVDCGLGVRDLDARLARAGLQVTQIDAIFITHEHSDHIGCAASLVKRHAIPIWMSRGTYRGIGMPEFGSHLQFAQDMDAIACGALQINPFTVPHDAKEPLQLTISDGALKLGILTDLGHSTPHVLEQLQGCDALLLETNHDLDMLGSGPYPAMLKKRVGGDWGHLNNTDSGAIAAAVQHSGLKHLVAAHLSLQNNTPALARAALAAGVGCGVDDILVADAKSGTDWLSL
jgi:phosphoribosyl 1,2-cyclic phosphodiesterase